MECTKRPVDRRVTLAGIGHQRGLQHGHGQGLSGFQRGVIDPSSVQSGSRGSPPARTVPNCQGSCSRCRGFERPRLSPSRGQDQMDGFRPELSRGRQVGTQPASLPVSLGSLSGARETGVIPVRFVGGVSRHHRAEGGGFEPPEACTSRLFKSRAFVRSAIPPGSGKGSRHRAGGTLSTDQPAPTSQHRPASTDQPGAISARNPSNHAPASRWALSTSARMAGPAAPDAGYDPRNLTPASSA